MPGIVPKPYHPSNLVGGGWQCRHMDGGWSDALRGLAVRLAGTDVEWMLVGSAATALHGAAIEPGDLDVAVSTAVGVRTAATVLPSRTDRSSPTDPIWFSSLAEPTLSFVDPAGGRWTFGRWTLARFRVELAHIDSPAPTDLLVETPAAAVWDERLVIDWKGTQIPVVPVEVQLATMIFRDQPDRLQATLAAVDPASLDADLLRRALAGRETGGTPLKVPDVLRERLANSGAADAGTVKTSRHG
ncbi:hypothetical protein E0H73_26870 [Kribbella pittospori]|uniref:Uncharacterized protein n=1 Tax=Kribbella pittospori TaxID=722689 RepID=A0A4R0KJ22_9ACTN|nr:hypothetical protein [Kribbella pittospori]TCC57978.1 hypothetical protein E0H73_26870 [Kribbella pittospori]